MNRHSKVIDAARDAVAILQGNHPAGDFAHPEEVARETLQAALIDHDKEPHVIDGGCAWSYATGGGLTLYNGDGAPILTIAAPALPERQPDREALIYDIAERLGLVTVEREPARG